MKRMCFKRSRQFIQLGEWRFVVVDVRFNLCSSWWNGSSVSYFGMFHVWHADVRLIDCRMLRYREELKIIHGARSDRSDGALTVFPKLQFLTRPLLDTRCWYFLTTPIILSLSSKAFFRKTNPVFFIIEIIFSLHFSKAATGALTANNDL